MKVVKSFFLLIARILLSMIFIVSAVHKILDWHMTERALVSLLCDWHVYVSNIFFLQKFFMFILPYAPIILIVATVSELIGGFLIFFNIKARFGAFILILFFIPTTILIHQFWFLEGIKRELQMIMFTKNIAILGGLLYVAIFGGSLNYKKDLSFDSFDMKNE